MLEINNLSVEYNRSPVLNNITLHLDAGEILCLLGHSGSGKTTLLRAIAGLEPPSTGTVCFAGDDLASIPPHRRDFGMMFQDYALFPHKSVAENIAFGLKMQKLGHPEITERIEEMLALVGLPDCGQRRIDQLSGGQQQRVALARSLAPKPRLLLLDEPLGSLDRSLRDRLAEEIRAILKRLAVSAVFVTHDQAEAFTVADRVAVMLNGRLTRLDTPEAVYRNPQSREVAAFLGFRNFITTTTGRLLLLRPEGALLAQECAEQGESVLSGIVHRRLCPGGHFRLTVGDIPTRTIHGVELGSVSTPLTFELPLIPQPPEEGKPVAIVVPKHALVFVDENPPVPPKEKTASLPPACTQS